MAHKCRYCEREFNSGVALGGHTGSCMKNPNRDKKRKKLSKAATNRILDENTKSKISKSMKKAHKDGRAWNIGQSRWNNEKSWPEKFFEKFLINESIDFENEFPVGIFSIDFALRNKIAIEIDGKTHFTDKETIERDKRKNKKLKEENWKLLRVKWTRLFNDSTNTLNEIKKFIENPIEYKELY